MMKKNLIVFLVLFLLVTGLNSLIYATEKNPTREVYFPLVVYGGEPEGVMAAVAAAREGIKTLIIMEREKPGGLMTYGALNYLDINYGPDGRNLNRGLFAEWHQRVGGTISFPIERAFTAFLDMLNREKDIERYRSCELKETVVENGEIKGIRVVEKNTEQEITIYAERVIDATQDASLAVMAGVPYYKGGEDIGLPERHMAVTLVLHFGNVDWKRLARDVRSNKFGPSWIDEDHAWGFVEIGSQYKPRNSNIRLRGLNIVYDNSRRKKEVYINSMLIFNIEPTDKASLKQAYVWGREEAVFVLDFLKDNLAGFENAVLLEFPEELYVRESRHIKAEYQLSVKDLFSNQIPADTIALASYPLDYQASHPEYNGFVLFNPDIYGIPLRSLLPRSIDNILVVGRSSGYSSLAAASARVLPTGMSTGEAAGLIAAYSLNTGLPLKEVSRDRNIVGIIQKKMNIDGLIRLYRDYSGNIKGFNPTEAHPYLQFLLEWGLVTGGYDNDFRLKDTMSEREFAHKIVAGLKQMKAPILYEWVPGGLETMSSDNPLTRDQAAMLLLVAISKRLSEMKEDGFYINALKYDLIPDIIQTKVKADRLLERGEAYIILANFLEKYLPGQNTGGE
jgi:hypothetical protein